MKDVTLDQRGQPRLHALNTVLENQLPIAQAAEVPGISERQVRRVLAAYRRQTPARRPKLKPYTGLIDRILESDHYAPRKQRHTVKRIHERLKDEYGFDGGYTTVKDYAR